MSDAIKDMDEFLKRAGVNRAIDTAMAREGADHPERPLVEPKPLVDGDSRPRRPPTDIFTITPEERKAYKIGDHEEPTWILDPQVWGPKAIGDTAADFLRQHPGRRLVFGPNGQLIRNGDLVLAVKSKEEVEELQRQIDADAEAYHREIQGDDISGAPPRFRREQFTAEDAQRIAEEHIASGAIGPTAGMSYFEVVRMLGAEEVEREAARWRRNGRTGATQAHIPASPEAAARVEDAVKEARDRARHASGARRSFLVQGFKKK